MCLADAGGVAIPLTQVKRQAEIRLREQFTEPLRAQAQQAAIEEDDDDTPEQRRRLPEPL